jgi:uncharacterized protein
MQALVGRTGVQPYELPDGSIRMEYRPPSEVFAADTIESLKGIAVTRGHPGRVTLANKRGLSIGTLLSGAKHAEAVDGEEWLVSEVLVDREDAIPEVGTKLIECSLAYDADLYFTPGITPKGEKYDVVQRNLRMNALGLGSNRFARAGRSARLRLDGDQEFVEEIEQNERLDSNMAEVALPKRMITCDGVSAEFGSETHVSLLERATKVATDRADALSKELGDTKVKLDAETKRADAAVGAQKAAEDKLKADGSPEKIEAKIKEAILFRGKLLPVLGNEYKFDGKTQREVSLDAVAKLRPERKFAADASDVEIGAYLEGALEGAKIDYHNDSAGETTFNQDANPYAAAVQKANKAGK